MLRELLSEMRFRLRAIFRRGRVERELDDELRFHLERETEKLVRAGMTVDAARRQAAITFGGIDRIKDDTRDARGVSWLEVLVQHVRYALRGLRRSPGFTAAVVLTLALGIGANAAMFDIVDRLLFRPPTYLRDPGAVHRVYFESNGRRGQDGGYYVEFTRYLDMVRFTHDFEQIGGFRVIDYAVGDGDATANLTTGIATATFFELFDVRPTLGRLFTRAEDMTPSGTAVAVISDGFWRTRYAARRTVLGERLRVGSVVYTIVGVLPPGFAGITTTVEPVVWIPSTSYAASMRFQRPGEYYTDYTWSWLQLVARRKPGVTVEAASADLANAFLKSWNAESALHSDHTPASIARPSAMVAPLHTWRGPVARPESKVMTWIAAVSVIVLLIACANVANLQLARAVGRQREIAVRLALGVSRSRLFGQLLTESVLLALIGGAAGVAIAPLGGVLLRRLFIPEATVAGGVNSRMLIAAALIAVVTGILAGLAPALHAIRAELTLALTTGGREGSTRRSRTRTALVVFQGALSVVLLIGAGLFARSLANVRALRLGYDVDALSYVTWNERDVQLDSAAKATLALRLEAAARQVGGVSRAARVYTAPFDMMSIHDLFVEGIDTVARLGAFTMQAASPEFFATMGTRIVKGRALSASDGSSSPRVVVVSEAMAGALWPGRSALGQCMRIRRPTAECTTVVGISENSRQLELLGPRAYHYYLPDAQHDRPSRGLFVRWRDGAPQAIEALRRRLQTEMPGTAFVIAKPMRELIDPTMRAWQFGATMFVAFGALALIVAAFGLYSVISYHVAQRRHELGVRVAMGARTSDLLRLVLREGVGLSLGGLGTGLLIGLVAGRWIKSLLYGVSPADPAIIVGAAVLLFVVALLASALPAIRAARIDPNVVLRSD